MFVKAHKEPNLNSVYVMQLLIFDEEKGDRELIENNTINYFCIDYYLPSFVKALALSNFSKILNNIGMLNTYEKYSHHIYWWIHL